jgi:hypothetical protein
MVPYVTSSSYGSTPSYGGYGSTAGAYGSNYNYNSGYGGGYGQPYNRVDFIQVGTILRVLPQITEENSILLEIIAEDSDATMVKVLSNGQENTIPEKTESKAETQVRVQNGQTIVLGGLRKGSNSEDVSKSVPVLSDIPILGRLFKNPSKKISNSNLLIFITTTIIDEGTQPEAERLARIDEGFANKLRNSKKTAFGRFADAITRNKDEIGVSVGQSGFMHTSGKRVTMEELRQKFAETKTPNAKVVVRKHPRAPQKIVDDIQQMATEAKIKFEVDDTTQAFVPDYDEMNTDAPAPAAENKKEDAAQAPPQTLDAQPVMHSLEPTVKKPIPETISENALPKTEPAKSEPAPPTETK